MENRYRQKRDLKSRGGPCPSDKYDLVALSLIRIELELEKGKSDSDEGDDVRLTSESRAARTLPCPHSINDG